MAPDRVTLKQLQELITKGKTIYDNSILEINQGGDTVRQLPELAPHYEISLSFDSIPALHRCYEESHDELFGMSDRLFWSDLMAICFSRTMTTYSDDPKCLEAIWRINIANEVTQGVIKTVCNGKQSVELKAGDDGFYALLATDHAPRASASSAVTESADVKKEERKYKKMHKKMSSSSSGTSDATI
ncbi:hypothetical protein TARUN_2391 [Trichoderma arundinaceum]|uniref:Uncharacterized protein n=1 Tax=Trichoderma arundinaceum TaxID=490622 RepID=A0A395NVF1_TRIAR|nr:hypothetical protein TARUN_2391 [Trichoderma arundinaceum]